jgi:hypothetical protein
MGAVLRARWLVNAGYRKEKPFSLRRKLARSEAERNKKWFLMPVAPNTKLTLRSQNVMHSDSHF